MIFTAKVNRLEYITRMGFDNTDEEKKQLMNYFSKLDRAAVLGIDKIELAALRKENAELVKALEEISATADKELGDWSSVMPAHIPDGLTFAWNIRAAADLAISKHKG